MKKVPSLKPDCWSFKPSVLICKVVIWSDCYIHISLYCHIQGDWRVRQTLLLPVNLMEKFAVFVWQHCYMTSMLCWVCDLELSEWCGHCFWASRVQTGNKSGTDIYC